MKKITLLKTLLMAVGLCMGTSAWAAVTETVVVNCDFNSGETLFTGVSRITVANDNNAKFTCANNSQNGYSLATYNFSSAIGNDATAVKIEFAFWIPNQNAAYRRFFTVGQADLRTGFSQCNYSTSGSMFAFGLARNSSANYFSINGASTTAAASAGTVLGAWAHAEIYVDHSAKTVNYKITSMDGLTTYYSANDVAFVDGSAAYCNQLDFFDCQNNTVSYLDNLVITKYKDDSKEATTYTVKYQNAEGDDLKDAAVYDTYVGDTYTASSADMATFYSFDTNKKYVYNTGNTSATATSTAASNVITLVFNEYNKIAYTVTAKNGEETLGTLASGNAYTDGSTSVTWNKFKQYDSKWYVTNTPYGKTITVAGNTDVAYSPSNIAYFFEAEELNTSRNGFPTASGTGYSGGSARRNYASGQMWTSAIAEGGVYTLTFPYSMANASESTVVIKTRDAGGNFTDTGFSLTTKTAGTFSEDITIPAGSSVAICNDVAYNSNILVDYLTLTPKEISVTVTGAGFATYVPSYDLDFSDTEIEAYKVKVNTQGVATLTQVEEVPAGTPVLLYYASGEKTEDIPVMTGAAAVSDNDLVAGTNAEVATIDGEYTNMILWWDKDNPSVNPIGFYFANGQTVAANRAYLHIANAMAPAAEARMVMIFADDETTGISDASRLMDNGERKNDNFFNLNGQRVEKPVKGLYIVNGKKVVIK